MREYLKKPVFTAPLLVLVIGVLSIVAGILLPKLQYGTQEELFLAYTVTELLVFVVPGIVYVKLKPRGYTAQMRLISFGFSALPFILLMFFVMAFGGILLSLIYARFGVEGSALPSRALQISGGDYISQPQSVIYVSLALAIVPAVAEEFVFRGILLREYRSFGMLPSVFICAFLFALIHYDLKLFPLYFLAGAALGAAAYTARSALASMILHALFNLFTLFLQPLVFNFISFAGGTVLVFYIVIGCFLLFLMLALGESERLFSDYSASGVESWEPKKKKSVLPRSLEIFTPSLFLCLLFFLLGALQILPVSG